MRWLQWVKISEHKSKLPILPFVVDIFSKDFNKFFLKVEIRGRNQKITIFNLCYQSLASILKKAISKQPLLLTQKNIQIKIPPDKAQIFLGATTGLGIFINSSSKNYSWNYRERLQELFLMSRPDLDKRVDAQPG